MFLSPKTKNLKMGQEEELKALGDKFRSARIERELSQTKLANRIGKDQPSINRLETGSVNPSYLYLLEVCDGLGVSLSDLLRSY